MIVPLVFLSYCIVAWIDGVAIFFAVLVVCLVTTINDYKKERQFLKLTEVAEAEKTVLILATNLG